MALCLQVGEQERAGAQWAGIRYCGSWATQKGGWMVQPHGSCTACPAAAPPTVVQVQPYGALSLKSSMPFTLDGTLGMFIRGATSANLTQQLGDVELQFEASSPSAYTISKSSTLKWVCWVCLRVVL